MRVISLNGGWCLSAGYSGKTFKAVVPGCVHTDLIAANAIDEKKVFFCADVSCCEDTDQDWTYTTDFFAQPKDGESVFLKFDGITSRAEVYLNEESVGIADNMFRMYRYDITKLISRGYNHLAVLFKKKSVNFCSRGSQSDSAVRTMARSLIRTAGIWKSVSVEFAKIAYIRAVRQSQKHSADGCVTLNLIVDVCRIGVSGSSGIVAVANVFYKNVSVAEASCDVDSDGTARLSLNIRNALHWWPNGMGEQPLYELHVELFDDRTVLDSNTQRIGLRTVELLNSKNGTEWTFRIAVNGKPLLIRGANWTTCDIFPSRPTRVEYAGLIKAANVANMNLLRVPGDGIYEHEHFYDLCDEYGILVWQDFMFNKNVPYPISDVDWRKEVLAELSDNVSRIAGHACLAVWCGGNQLDLASSQLYCADDLEDIYRKFFTEIIPAAVSELDSDHPYIPSSAMLLKSGEIVKLGVICDIRQDARAYSREPAPFYTAFGISSIPFGQIGVKMQKLDAMHSSCCRNLMSAMFRPPRDSAAAVIISQLMQGITIKTLVENLRRCPERTFGIIFSRLNDPIAQVSESSLGSECQWKCLHYFARKFYSNVLITGVPNVKNGTVEIFLHNDSNKLFDGKIRWRIIDTSGRVWREMEKTCSCQAHSVKCLGFLKLTDLLKRVGASRIFVWLRLFDVDGYSPASECIRFMAPKYIKLEDPQIETDVRQCDDHWGV